MAMTRDDIIRMALKCGASIKSDCEGNGAFCDGMDLIAFSAIVAAAEREACAKVCENIYTGEEGCGDWPTPEMCAEAIRARGQ